MKFVILIVASFCFYGIEGAVTPEEIKRYRTEAARGGCCGTVCPWYMLL